MDVQTCELTDKQIDGWRKSGSEEKVDILYHSTRSVKKYNESVLRKQMYSGK